MLLLHGQLLPVLLSSCDFSQDLMIVMNVLVLLGMLLLHTDVWVVHVGRVIA